MIHDYFNSIDTEAKAYFLGFFVADGNISKTTNKMTFNINPKDSYILEKFKFEIQSSNKIGFRDVPDKRTGKIYKNCSFQFSSEIMKRDLLKHGVGINKSNYFLFPEHLSDDMKWHFLRGMIDGDGSISKTTCNINLISTLDCLNAINNFTSHYNILWNNARFPIKSDNNVWKMQMAKGEYNTKFINHLYNDATIFLHRKKENALIQLQIINNHSIGIKQRRIAAYSEDGKLLYKFDTVEEFVDTLKLNVSEVYRKIKNNQPYKDMYLVMGDLIKTNIPLKQK